MEIENRVGQLMRELRQHKGLSLREAGKLLGMSASTLSRIERSKEKKISVADWDASLKRYLGVSLLDLLDLLNAIVAGVESVESGEAAERVEEQVQEAIRTFISRLPLEADED